MAENYYKLKKIFLSQALKGDFKKKFNRHREINKLMVIIKTNKDLETMTRIRGGRSALIM